MLDSGKLSKIWTYGQVTLKVLVPDKLPKLSSNELAQWVNG